jgi:hypothetical protein
MGVSLHRGPLGNLRRGPVYRELREIVEGGLRKWSISLHGSSVKGTWRCNKKALGMNTSFLFPWEPRWKTGERAHMPRAYVWKKVLGWVSPHIGTPLGGIGRGSIYR